MWNSIVIPFVLAMGPGCSTLPRTTPETPAKERYWEKFPAPPGRSAGVSSLGLDRNHGLWMMSGQGTYFWNAKDREWSKPILGAGQYLTKLYGGQRTGLYATQRGKKDHWGEVYRLENGQARYVTEFYYDVAHDCAGFHVADEGRLFNWGGKELRIYEDGEWIERRAELPQVGPLVLDQGACVSLYFKGRLYIADERGEISEREVARGVNREADKGALWGDNKVILPGHGSPGVTAFELPSGHLVNTDEINSALGERSVYDLFCTADGSVWIIAFERTLASYVLYHISADGTTKLVRDTAGIPWEYHQFLREPQSVLVDNRSRLWFASNKIGVFCLLDDEVHQFDHRVDSSPASCSLLLEGQDGSLYVGSGTGLYAFNNGSTLTGRPIPRIVPVAGPGAPVWKYELQESDRLRMAWYVEGLILFTSRHEKMLTALDPANGRTRFSIPVSGDDADNAWVTTGRRGGELTVCLRDRILAIDAASGSLASSLECKRDHRLAPIVVGNDYILTRGYRGDSISRVAPSGEDVWTFRLSGYLMTHPSAFGPLLLAQTRQGSYGGQTSWGIDINTGEQLWNDTINAYGAGTAFADDARYCVETDSYLAPDTTEAWLISRDPRTGTRLWHYRKPGTTVDHAPLIDRATDRVYAALRDGTVVCLDGTSGACMWERHLPQPPAPAPAASYDPYHSCMSLAGGVLAVTDSTQLLYLLDPADGRVLRRLAVTEDVIRLGKRAGTTPLTASPWFIGSLLVVPAENGIVAYPISGSN